MKLVRLPIEELRLDPQNLRHHGNENLELIKKSLKASGQYKPLIIDRATRVVKIGNGRLQAMRELGWTEAWCVEVDFAQHPGMEVLDNRLNELSQWQDASIDDWLKNDKGLDWWGVDAAKSLSLARSPRSVSAPEGESKEKTPPAKKSPPLCPCCGKPLRKARPVFL